MTQLGDRVSPSVRGYLLHSFGIRAVFRAYDSSESPTPKMLSDVDHWLMNGVCESTLV